MRVIFALTSGRSGTMFLTSLIRNNVRNIVSKHEPYPHMFGRCVYWHGHEKIDSIRRVFQIKKRRIERCRANVYIETSHAFLKSFCDVAMESFPNMKLLHVLRDPIQVAKSESNRREYSDKWRLPFHYYRGDDGKRYFRWSLTGNEEIFQETPIENRSLFQFYVLQWIEMENRAMQFLDRHQKHSDCFRLDAPGDLKNLALVKNLFDFFTMETVSSEIRAGGRRNRNRFPTIVAERDKDEFAEALSTVPAKYLQSFSKEPYTSYPWAEPLSQAARALPGQTKSVAKT